MDVPVSSDDVLAQRTRARIFAWLVEHRTAAGTDELAAGLDLHPNGVRRHLELLHEAGLVERHKSRGGQGRPGDRWLIAADAQPGGRRPSAYAELAGWLARAMPVGRGRLREVERAGREIGTELAPSGRAEDPVEGFRQVLVSLGFQPVLEQGAHGEFTCRLENCPYRDSVRENADLVCGLHRGITTGLLAELVPGAELVRFEPHDPERAGCVVGVSGPNST